MTVLTQGFLPMLLGWSAAWLAASVVGLWVRRERGFWGSFWFMSGLWCVVNAGIAVWSLLAPPADAAAFRELLLINSGLDVGYLVVGGVLLAQKKSMPRGFGLAIVVQGAFLLVFDLAWWAWLGERAAGG